MIVRRKVPTPEQSGTMVLKQSKCENLKAANYALKEVWAGLWILWRADALLVCR